MTTARDWSREYDQAIPPLPDPVPAMHKGPGLLSPAHRWMRMLRNLPNESLSEARSGFTENVTEDLRAGTWFVSIRPTVPPDQMAEVPGRLIGVVRIHHQKETQEFLGQQNNLGFLAGTLTSGSGDLYACTTEQADELRAALENLLGDTELSQEEKVRRYLTTLRLPIENYRYYLRLDGLVLLDTHHLVLEFDTYRWDPQEFEWEQRQRVAVALTPQAQATDALDVINSFGTLVATATAVAPPQVSSNSPTIVRHATINVHKDPDPDVMELSIDEPGKNQWKEVLEKAGWSAEVGEKTILDEERDLWTGTAIRGYHNRLIEPPGTQVPTWTYNLLLVKNFTKAAEGVAVSEEEYEGGWMYDVGDESPHGRARVGAIVAAWKPTKSGGQRQDNAEQYNATAMHEFGHMQGLYHSEEGLLVPFVGDRPIEHSKADAYRLRHLPDLWVSPGPVPFGSHYHATAFEVRDLVPETPDLHIELDTLPNTITGQLLRHFTLRLRHPDESLYYPHTDVLAWSGENYLGLRLRSPSGNWIEPWPLNFPPILDYYGNGVVWTPSGVEVVYPDIAWEEDLREVGIYQVHLDITWSVRWSHFSSRVFRRHCVSPLQVGQ